MSKRRNSPFPTREQVAEFIRQSPTPVGKREIARAFQIGAADRVALKELLRGLQDDGAVERGRRRRVAAPGHLPEVAALDIRAVDTDGEVLAAPAVWEDETPPPRIFMAPERRGHPALALGDRVLARLRRLPDGAYEARTIRRLDRRAPAKLVGVFLSRPGGGVVRPADRKKSEPVFVAEADRRGARDGELVVAELRSGARLGPAKAVVVERLGDKDHPRSVSLIAIHSAGIPTVFPPEAVAQAEAAGPATLDGRQDLRDLPLVTIDGADARDFDDAVWAEPDPDPRYAGGWHLVVAIADVAHYVPPGSALDREAFRRGNSCYFPDRVVPMLPEALSNGLCSLRPGEPRACLAAHLWIDRDGRLRRHRFVRGLMRSAARLVYEQVQAARDGRPDEVTGPLLGPVIEPLYGAFAALLAARRQRGTLDLDVPERQVRLDPSGRVAAIGVRARLDSHRLIEEFMIAANVAAAETLQKRGMPLLYRVHDAPDPARVEALRDFLEPLGYSLARGQALRPRLFGQVLARAEGRPESELISQMILRSQAQAIYSPENIGHFGLALSQYAHFTSPIRRYADLIVHRALIRALDLGAGGLSDDELARLAEIGEHVSFTERRAAMAERDAVDRYVAAYLAERIGQRFTGKISGVTRFGLFVALDETGADGLVPIATLPDDYYEHDESSHALVGRSSGRVFRLGAPVRVRVVEADPVSGATTFALVDAEGGADLDLPGLAGRPAPRPRRPVPRPASRRPRRRERGAIPP